MKFESEVVVEELLPAMRSVVASRLQVEYGLNQYEIADKLEVTQPAVSKYLNNKRADEKIIQGLKDDPQTSILLSDITEKVAQDEKYVEELESLVTTVRDKGIMKEEFGNAERIL